MFDRATVLVVGALLAVRTRTVTAALRITGHDDACFSSYHRVLSRARWSCLDAARILLALVVDRLVPDGPVVVAVDDTIERRWGPKIAARSIYRDPVRSSLGFFVKVSGLRWLSLSILADVPFAGRVWALPVLSVLCPSARFYERARRAPATLLDRARQAVRLLARWLPGRQVVVVADSGFAAVAWLSAIRTDATVVTRLRLDAALYGPVPPRTGKPGRPRTRGARLPSLAAQSADPATRWSPLVVSLWYGRRDCAVEIATGTALWYRAGVPGVWLRWVVVRDPSGAVAPKGFLCTDASVEPAEMLGWYLRRWSVEVTFAEVRRHLGVETQRQWSGLAIARTTPCLLGLFSVVALVASDLHAAGKLSARQSAWHPKTSPTFSDALASVRVELWRASLSEGSATAKQMPINAGAVFERMSAALAYAA